jgi:membrane-associated phospholipid phosphatase
VDAVRSVDPARGLAASGITARLRAIWDGRAALAAGLRNQDLTQFGFISLLAATVFVTMMAAGNNVLSFDVSISRAVQGSGIPGLAEMANFVSVAGGTIAMFTVGAAILLWLVRAGHYAATVPVLAALALRIGNAVIKTTVDSPRPTSDYVRVLEDPTGNGFPSAHVMGVVLLYGVIVILANELITSRLVRLPVQIVSVAMILMVGPGRIYTGAHWPTDVLGAYLYGALFLIPTLVAYQTLKAMGPIRLPAPRPASLLRLAGLPVSRKG